MFSWWIARGDAILKFGVSNLPGVALRWTPRDQPVHLYDAYMGSVRATYRPYNALDEMESPSVVSFCENGRQIVTGGFRTDRMLQIFDLNRSGREPLHTLKLGKTRRSKDGQKGLVSAIASGSCVQGFAGTHPHYNLLAVGTYSPGSIYLYDTRCYQASDVSSITSVSGTCIVGHGKSHGRKRKHFRYENHEDNDDDDILNFSAAKIKWYQTRAQGGVTQLQFSPNSHDHLLYSASRRSNAVLAWDLRRLSSMSSPSLASTSAHCPGVASYETNNDTNQRLQFSFRDHNGNSQLWIGGKDGCVRVYDCQSHQLFEKIEIEDGGVDYSQAVNGVSLFNPSQCTKSLLAVTVGSRQFPTESYWNMDEDDHSDLPSGGAESIRIYELCQQARNSAIRRNDDDVVLPTTTKNKKKNTTNTDAATVATSAADAATASLAPITATCGLEYTAVSTAATLPSSSACPSIEHKTAVAACDAAASKKVATPTINGEIVASLKDESYSECAKQPAKKDQIKSEDVDDVVVQGTDKSSSAMGKSKDPKSNNIRSGDEEYGIQSSPEFKFLVGEALANHEKRLNQRKSMAARRLDKEFQDIIELDQSSDDDVQVLSPGEAAKERSKRTGTKLDLSSDDDVQVLSPGEAAKASRLAAQRTGPKRTGYVSSSEKATSKRARASPSKELKLTDYFSPSQSPTSRKSMGRPPGSSHGRSSLSSDSDKKPAASAVSRGKMKPPPPSSLSSRKSDGHDAAQPQGSSSGSNYSSFAASILDRSSGNSKPIKENTSPRVKSDPSRNSPHRRRSSAKEKDAEGGSSATAICID